MTRPTEWGQTVLALKKFFSLFKPLPCAILLKVMDSVFQPDTAKKINLAPAPWTMHEFFAGSGLVAYGLKGMFRPVWSNDICPQKAAVYQSNFESNHFILDDIKNISGGALPAAHLSWASFPCQDLSLAGSIGGIDAKRSGLVWEWLRIIKEMPHKPSLLLISGGLIPRRSLCAAIAPVGFI